MHVLCDFAMCLYELSYTFDHIWTNLLTQCTLVPVPVFCCFSIPGFPHIKNAPKIWEKSGKKISATKSSRITKVGPDGHHQVSRQPPGASMGAPGPLVVPWL